MTDAVLLDAGPLGMISHPRASGDIVEWLATLVAAGVEVLIPEVADYEVRRELLRTGRGRGIERLDILKVSLGFVPITSEAMLRAAAFWADARRRGRPTASDQSLDADAILAGQAATLNRSQVIVASSNPKHIARFVPAQRWQDIPTQR
jgi:predicted nucleic acid-binding protein